MSIYKSNFNYLCNKWPLINLKVILSVLVEDITSKVNKVLIGFCSKCNGKKSLTFSDDTIQAEALRDLFKNLGKKRS